jgi:hypothetical protein
MSHASFDYLPTPGYRPISGIDTLRCGPGIEEGGDISKGEWKYNGTDYFNQVEGSFLACTKIQAWCPPLQFVENAIEYGCTNEQYLGSLCTSRCLPGYGFFEGEYECINPPAGWTYEAANGMDENGNIVGSGGHGGNGGNAGSSGSGSSGVVTEYTVTADGGKYLIDGVTNPVLEFTRGNTYVFDVSDASTDLHPLYITSSNVGGAPAQNVASHPSGVTGNGNKFNVGDQKVTYVVPHGAPDTLYYQCGSHANMGNRIDVTNGNVTSSFNSTTNANFTGTTVALAGTTTQAAIPYGGQGVTKGGVWHFRPATVRDRTTGELYKSYLQEGFFPDKLSCLGEAFCLELQTLENTNKIPSDIHRFIGDESTITCNDGYRIYGSMEEEITVSCRSFNDLGVFFRREEIPRISWHDAPIPVIEQPLSDEDLFNNLFGINGTNGTLNGTLNGTDLGVNATDNATEWINCTEVDGVLTNITDENGTIVEYDVCVNYTMNGTGSTTTTTTTTPWSLMNVNWNWRDTPRKIKEIVCRKVDEWCPELPPVLHG